MTCAAFKMPTLINAYNFKQIGKLPPVNADGQSVRIFAVARYDIRFRAARYYEEPSPIVAAQYVLSRRKNHIGIPAQIGRKNDHTHFRANMRNIIAPRIYA